MILFFIILNVLLQNVINDKKKAIMKQDFDLASTYKEKEKELLTKKNDLELNLMTKRKPKKITKEMVADVIYLKTKIPVYEINKSSRKIINNLDRNLKKIVLGQDEIITDLCNRVKKVRLGFQDKPHI